MRYGRVESEMYLSLQKASMDGLERRLDMVVQDVFEVKWSYMGIGRS